MWTDDLIADKKQLLEDIIDYPEALEEASEQLREDKFTVLQLVKINGYALEFAPKFQNDDAVVKAAIRQNPFAYQFASEKLKRQRHILVLAEKLDESVVSLFPPEIIDIKLNSNPMLLAYMPNSLRGNKNFIKPLLKKNGLALQFIDNDLIKDKEIALAAVTQNGLALAFVDQNIN